MLWKLTAALLLWIGLAAPAFAALGIAQNSTITFSSAGGNTVTLPGAPTVGNVVVQYCGVGSSSTLNGTKWTSIASGGSGNGFIFAAYRYVQGGDTSTLPNFFSASGNFVACFAYEISGVSGTWTGHDFEQSDALYQQTGGTLTTTTVTTTHANDLVLLGAFNYWNTNPAADITGGSGYTSDNAAHNFADYGAVNMLHHAFAGSGSNISTSFTIPATGSSNPSGYIAVVLSPSAVAVKGGSLPLIGVGQLAPLNDDEPWLTNENMPGKLLLRARP